MSAGNGGARKLSDLEAERRRLSSQKSKISQRKVSPEKDRVRIIVNGAAQDQQLDLSMMLPLIFQDDTEGYDLGALIDKAMEAYQLKSRFGV